MDTLHTVKGITSTDTPARRRKLARQERDARRGRLGQGRYGALVKELAAVTRLAFEAGSIGSSFGLEGPLRHSIRGDLCRQGWRWAEADLLACEMLDDTFLALRVSRPDWNEGQPEWTIHAGTLIERTRCARPGCHRPLTGEQKKFCGAACAASWHMYLTGLKQADQDSAVKTVIQSLWT